MTMRLILQLSLVKESDLAMVTSRTVTFTGHRTMRYPSSKGIRKNKWVMLLRAWERNPGTREGFLRTTLAICNQSLLKPKLRLSSLPSRVWLQMMMTPSSTRKPKVNMLGSTQNSNSSSWWIEVIRGRYFRNRKMLSLNPLVLRVEKV